MVRSLLPVYSGIIRRMPGQPEYRMDICMEMQMETLPVPADHRVNIV